MRKLFLAISAIVTLAFIAGPTLAEPPMPTGTISINQSDLRYNGYVSFNTTVEGRVNNQAFLYTRLVCWTDPGDVVFQAASRDLEFTYLLTDQSGQGLDWQPDEVPATCQADLVYRVEKPKNMIIQPLDSVLFTVN